LPAEFSHNIIATVPCNIYVRNYISSENAGSNLSSSERLNLKRQSRYIKYRCSQTRDAERACFRNGYFILSSTRRELSPSGIRAIRNANTTRIASSYVNCGGWDIYTRSVYLRSARALLGFSYNVAPRDSRRRLQSGRGMHLETNFAEPPEIYSLKRPLATNARGREKYTRSFVWKYIRAARR